MLRSIAFISMLPSIALLGCSSAEKACTLIGCASSVEVGFTGANDKAGSYDVNLMTDGDPSSCHVTLPWDCTSLRPCLGGGYWTLLVTGCPPAGQRIEGFVFAEHTPASVDFVVLRDGIMVGGDSLHPEYQESHPNGSECGPVCRHAPRFEAAIAP